MRQRWLAVLVMASCAWAAGSMSADAQQRAKADRIGGKPNLNGIWQAMITAYWNLEAHAASPLNDFWRLGAIGAIPAG